MTDNIYRSPLGTARNGFGRLLISELTKLRSVPRWVLTFGAAVLLTILVAMLTVMGAQVASSGGPPPPSVNFNPFVDGGHFAYQPVTGDGTITARVASQVRSSDWAKAGLMIRTGEGDGDSFVAVMVTPDHGVRVRAGTEYEASAGSGAAPMWLRLTLVGGAATAYASTDGTTWQQVGTLTLANRPSTVDVGMFVASADNVKLQRQFGGESLESNTTVGEATFDNVGVTTTAGTPTGAWTERARTANPEGPAAQDSGFTEQDGTFTLSGPGDLGPDRFAEDNTKMTLTAVLIGATAVIALAALFVTAEYRRGMMRTTLLVTPGRGRVLAAKAVVMGVAAFVAGLLATFGSFLVIAPIQHAKGLRSVPLLEWPVLRALIGTALLLGLIAVFSVAVGTILRRGAAAITVVLVALLLPKILSSGLPLSVASWVERLTPSAGFAIEQTIPRYDVTMSPFAGLGVMGAYTALAVGLAVWRLRRRDA